MRPTVGPDLRHISWYRNSSSNFSTLIGVPFRLIETPLFCSIMCLKLYIFLDCLLYCFRNPFSFYFCHGIPNKVHERNLINTYKNNSPTFYCGTFPSGYGSISFGSPPVHDLSRRELTLLESPVSELSLCIRQELKVLHLDSSRVSLRNKRSGSLVLCSWGFWDAEVGSRTQISKKVSYSTVVRGKDLPCNPTLYLWVPWH